MQKSSLTLISINLLSILFLSLLVTTAKADLGEPQIQAVCKLTLTNEKTIEGFITLGYGGYNGNWMNGFYLECYDDGKYKHELKTFFTMAFKSFTRMDSSYVFDYLKYRNCRKIKFLQWMYNPTGYLPQKLTYEESGVLDTLRITTHIERKYLAMDSLRIYFEIPSTTYLDSQFDTISTTKFQMVAIKDILKFELLEHPSQNWINMIESVNRNAQEQYNGAESSGDFLEAAWYHEIITNQERFEQLQKGIIYNIER